MSGLVVHEPLRVTPHNEDVPSQLTLVGYLSVGCEVYDNPQRPFDAARETSGEIYLGEEPRSGIPLAGLLKEQLQSTLIERGIDRAYHFGRCRITIEWVPE